MSVTTTVGLDFMLNSITGAARLENMVEGAMSGGAIKGLTGAIGATQKKLETAYGQAYVNSIRLGAKEESKQLEATFGKRQEKIRRASRLQASLEAKLEEIKDRADQSRRASSLRARLANIDKIINAQQQGQDRLIMEMNAAQKDRLELLDQGMQKSAQGFGAKLEGGAEKFGSMMQTALSAENLNVGDLVKNIGGALKDAAPNMMKFGAKNAGKGGVMGGLGKAAASLGAAAGAIAGIAAGLGAVIALFAAAYGQTKEFNKSILEGSSAIDLLSGSATASGRALKNELGAVRDAAIEMSLEYRMAATDMIGFVKEMNKAGLQFKDITMVFGSYGMAMRKAVHWTQTFGVGGGEVADLINKMTEDMGRSLTTIDEGFGQIYGAAQLSSMGVASFFTSINEATSGMALMNFRLEDTVELLLGMEKILGGALAKETLGGLKGKYQDMGFQERYKTSMMAGGAGRAVYGKVAARLGAGYAGDLSAAANSAGKDTSKGVLAKILNADGSLNSQHLGSIKGQELGALQNELAELGPEFEVLARRLGDMSQLQRGTTGGTGRQAAGLAGLDEAGTLAYSMVSALGDRAIGDMEGVDRMAFEEQTGISGKQFDIYQEIFNRKAGELSAAGEPGSGAGGRFTMSDIAKVIADGNMMTAEDKARLTAAADEPESQMEQIAQNQLDATVSILQVLKNQVVSILNSMNGFMESILNIMPWGGPSAADMARDQAQEATQSIQESMDALALERKTAEDAGDFSRTTEFQDREKALGLSMQAAVRTARTGEQGDLRATKTNLREGLGITQDDMGLLGLNIDGGHFKVDEAGTKTYMGSKGSMAPMPTGLTQGPRLLNAQGEPVENEDQILPEDYPKIAAWKEENKAALAGMSMAPEGEWGDLAMDRSSPLGASLYGSNAGPHFDHDLNPDAPFMMQTGGGQTHVRKGEATTTTAARWGHGGGTDLFGKPMAATPGFSDEDLAAANPMSLMASNLMFPDTRLGGGGGWSETDAMASWDGIMLAAAESADVEGTELPQQTTALERIQASVAGLPDATDLAGVLAGSSLRDAGVDMSSETAARTDLTRMLFDSTSADYVADQSKRAAIASNFEAHYGKPLLDFIYRSGPTKEAMGTIHPISGRDVVGALPENWSKGMGGGGGGVSIGNLTIYESGDPNKTFAMVKAAIKAAKV